MKPKTSAKPAAKSTSAGGEKKASAAKSTKGGAKSAGKAPPVKEAVSKAAARQAAGGAKQKPSSRVSRPIALGDTQSGSAKGGDASGRGQPMAAETKKKASPAKVPAGKQPKTAAGKSTTGKAAASKPAASDKPAPGGGSVSERLREMQRRREEAKDLSQPVGSRFSLNHQNPPSGKQPDPKKDRLVLLVRDPYWLHASWDVTRRTVQRVKASLAGQWHTVKPTLRLMNAEDAGTTSNAESVLCDIEIHSGVRNWFIPVPNPPGSFVAALGYLSPEGRFHELCRSNRVRTPAPGSSDAVDDHWADIARDAERIYGLSGGYDEDYRSEDLRSMMEERLNRPLSSLTGENFGSGNGSLGRAAQFFFELDVELMIFGATQPDSRLLVGGEPASVREDGSFAIRHPMPNTRQVIPITARNRDGTEEQTIVIAVERNTKTMDPVSNSEVEE